MDLTPYLESLRQELRASAAPAGEDAARTAELLGNALDSAARLCLLEALSDAAAEITSKLSTASVEVRLRGREAEFVVTEQTPEPAPAATTKIPEGGDTARITLRLPEQLKELIENASSTTGASVNSWLVHAVAGALNGMPPAPPPPPFPPQPPHGRGKGRRMTGYAQA
jgi:hypothetical protein